MNVKRMVRKLKQKITEPKESMKLESWKRKYEAAKMAYSSELSKMDTFDALYDGNRSVNGNPNSKKQPSKVSVNVRNITYELIESQVDSSIPMPKVTPIHEEDADLAKIIEQALMNEIRLLKFNEINDMQERTVPTQGGDFMHVEWDNTKGFHCNIGGLSVSERHPRCVIPQPGTTDIDSMDYIFVLIAQTKGYVKRKYNVDVKDAFETEKDIRVNSDQSDTDMVTIIKTYYRNEKGGIGLFTWCDDYILEDMEDYQARRLQRCTKCGRVKEADECECGNKKFKWSEEEYEELTEDISLYGTNNIIPAVTYEEQQAVLNNELQFDENGMPVMVEMEVKTKIPYYKPDLFPIVLRRNVSKSGYFLGCSDADVIQDQQDAIKKIGSNIQEKLLKIGPVLTLPNNLSVKVTDEIYRIIRVNNANEANLINVKNLTADLSQDRIMLETNYDWAKSTLGITDSYQGKYDSSATSGTAKQYAINQAAGRLESKRVMKNAAYAKLYEMMFKFMLAYADQPIPISTKNHNGQYSFSHFNRYDFLKQDSAGEFYWDDEFVFETDPTSTIMMNREAMWQQADLKLQSGAFGPLGELDTLLMYWTYMEQNDYPNAAETKKWIEAKKQEQEALMQQMMQGGGQNVVPGMQGGNGNQQQPI